MEHTNTEELKNVQVDDEKSEGRRRKKKRGSKIGRLLTFIKGIGKKLLSLGKNYDFLLVLFTAMLAIFGLIMIFSASYYSSINDNGSPYYYLIKHGGWLGIGAMLFWVGSHVDYHIYNNRKFGIFVAVAGVILLGLLFTPLGATINGATRWINLGPITIMPGELAKLCAIFFTAWYLSEDTSRIHSLVRGVIPVVGLGGLYAVLIVKQPNLSTALTVVGIVGCMLIVAGLHKRYILLAVCGVGAGIFSLTTFLRHTYWYERFASFTDPFADPLGDGYQVVQSLLAMGTGGLTGVGLGKSVQKNLYLPEPQNDFILAIIGEELGFIGIILLLLLYCAFIWRGVHISIHTKDQFGMLLSSGIVLMVAIQVILNVAVVTSSMPPTGINLPFISYGGNAILIFMFATGVLVNISKQIVKSEPRIKEGM